MARNFFDSLRTVFSLWTKHSFLPFFALSGFIFHLLLYHPPLENCGFPVLKPFCSHFGNNDSENEFVKSLMNYSGYNKEKEIEALCPALPSSVFETLVLLFPSSNKLVDTDNEYSKYSLSKDPNTNYIEKRICSPRYFNIYFTLSLDSIMVPSRKIDASLTTMSKDELKDFLNSVTDQHLLSNYLEDINVKSLKIGTNVRLIRSFGTMPKTVGCSLYKGHPFHFVLA